MGISQNGSERFYNPLCKKKKKEKEKKKQEKKKDRKREKKRERSPKETERTSSFLVLAAINTCMNL